MTPKIDINVVGSAAVGKTTVCAIINEALEQYGIFANVNLLDNEDVSDPHISQNLSIRASTIAARDITITINELQARVPRSVNSTAD